LEVGSKDYGITQNIRYLFSSEETYVGIDISEGKGVELALDFTDYFNEIDKRLHTALGYPLACEFKIMLESTASPCQNTLITAP
jgi:hypothetical protein